MPGSGGVSGDGSGDSGGDGVFGDGNSGSGAGAPDGTPGSGQSQEELPSFAPKILVESCRLTPENPKAGEEVTAEITLVNTSRKESVKSQ